MRIPAWRRYLRFWRPDVNGDVDEELRFHFSERMADLVARGRTPEAARAEALAEFGDVEATRAALCDIDRRVVSQRQHAVWWDGAWQDARYAVRSLGRARLLAGTIVLTLALGIGLNAAMFSFLDAVFLRPPSGVTSPDALRRVWARHFVTADHVPFAAPSFSYPDYLAMASAVRGSADLAAYTTDTTRLGKGEGALAVDVASTTANYFHVLGTITALGGFYGPDEDRMGAGAPVAVLSHSLWERHFGGDSAVIGRQITVGRARYTVIGVAQAGFDGIDLDAIDIWLPIATAPQQWYNAEWYRTRNFQGIWVFGRLQPRVDDRSVEARLTTLLRRPVAEGPPTDTLETAELGSIIFARGPGHQDQKVAIALRLGGVALIVLLIACANVTNLLLARAVQRRREIAVRLALGMSRTRLGAMLLTETVLLAVTAAVAAALAALWGGSLLRTLLMPNVRWSSSVFDWRVVAFTAAIALAAGIATGLAPAVQTGRDDLTVALKAGVRAGPMQRSRLRVALLVLQGALSIVLLAAAGAFLRSLRNVERVDFGYDIDRLVYARVDLGDLAPDARERVRTAMLPLVAQRLGGAPGVEGVGMAAFEPMLGFSALPMFLPGRDSLVFPHMPPVFTPVSRNFFAVSGTRVLRGRGFDPRGSGSAEVVVTEELARTLWPHEDALGKCILFGTRASSCYTVVGVVENVRHWDLTEAPWPEYYLPMDQMPGRGFTPTVLVIRTARGRGALVASEARRLLHDAIPAGEPSVQSLADMLSPQFRPWRLGAQLFSIFGLLALCLAAVGTYSTLSYTVGQRTHEIGVRIALGARAADLVGLVLRDAIRFVGLGVAVGVVLALLLGRLIASQLYGTSPHDPLTLAATTAVLLVAAAMAALVPARRAARVDPLTALRSEE